MTTPAFLDTSQGRRIAYHRTEGQTPWVVFLGGLSSDMTGTKAVHLEAWAKARGQAFLRFDYSGHGESSGSFIEGCVGEWAEDAVEAITALTDGPLVLVGSSMGGWVGLLLSQRMPERLAALVTIAGAPDFTEDGYWNVWSEAQKTTITEEGQIALPSDYGDDLIITRHMIEDGRNQLVMRSPLPISVPVRLLQGSADVDVPMSVALNLFDHIDGDDVRLEVVKHADHRFSDDTCLAILTRTVEEVLASL